MASSLLFNEKDEKGCFPSLSFTERLLCFGGCFVIGTLISVLSFGSFGQILAGKPERFALTYTIGNLISILGTSFLVGFKRQFKNMSDPTRKYTTLVFVLSMIGVLVSALYLKKAGIVMIFLIVEVCAYVWYSASYIPFARTCIKKVFKNCISDDK